MNILCENCGESPATTSMTFSSCGRDIEAQHSFCTDCANALDVDGTGYHRVVA